MRQHQSPLLNGLPEAGPLRFVATNEISRGGCIIQTRFGLIDARRETKFEQLRQSLCRHDTHDFNPIAGCNTPLRRVREARVTETCGRVVQLIGLVVESEGPLAALGEVCRIISGRGQAETLAEVVGFRNQHLLLMPLGEMHGIHPGSEVIATGAPMRVAVGDALKGPRDRRPGKSDR